VSRRLLQNAEYIRTRMRQRRKCLDSVRNRMQARMSPLKHGIGQFGSAES